MPRSELLGLLLLLLPACLGGPSGRQIAELNTQLVAKAQQGDAVALWRAASEGAAAAVVRALREQRHDVELQVGAGWGGVGFRGRSAGVGGEHPEAHSRAGRLCARAAYHCIASPQTRGA